VAVRRRSPVGYALYDQLTPGDRRTLAQRIDALAEPFSCLAAIVNGAG
jgi:iron uptake system EfeUOB component EfeO/EfeM